VSSGSGSGPLGVVAKAGGGCVGGRRVEVVRRQASNGLYLKPPGDGILAAPLAHCIWHLFVLSTKVSLKSVTDVD